MPNEPAYSRGYCNCFDRSRAPVRGVDEDRFRYLPDPTRRLVGSWFNRAWEQREASGEAVFEPFIYAWIAFNGWAMCVTDRERDSECLNMLMASAALCERFRALREVASGSFLRASDDFAALWPIFEAKSIRRRGVRREDQHDRALVIATYLERRIRHFEPQCSVDHQNRSEPTPIDWSHTLAAIYRVRCNLFHGEKVASSEADQRIVGAALRVLVTFMREGGYL